MFLEQMHSLSLKNKSKSGIEKAEIEHGAKLTSNKNFPGSI